MAERPGFQARQFEFAAHIRDPEHVAVPPGIDDRRMAVYRDLFFNNLRNLLGTMFPVLKKLLPDDRWRHLIREFMRVHRARTPYFLQLPREFLDFLANEHDSAGDYPFLAELAHYEYAELDVSIEPGTDAPDRQDAGDNVLDGVPVRRLASRVYIYRWPVHRISTGYIPERPADSPVCLAIYRDDDDKVRFVELNLVTAQLLERIGDNPQQESGAALLQKLASDIGYGDTAAFLEHGAGILSEMRDLGIIRITRRT